MFKSHRIMPKLAISTLALTAALATNAADSSRLFNIKAQSLDKALSQLSIQSDVIVVAPQQLVSGMKSSALNGAMSITDALEALLKGTGLKYSLTSDGAVLIEASEPEDSAQEEVEDIEEVIVTGSALVKDPGQVTKNVTIYDRRMIEASGATTLEEFMRTVPQNINAATEVASGFAGEFGGAFNVFGASGINLRGLGEQATLILINGRRTANGGSLGNAVDISTIPLSQVERIDVLLDGASSIYGADAMGGVVNIITRDDYSGGLVMVEYQTPQDGGTEQQRLALAKTFSWDSGNVSVNYSYLHRTRLNGEERPGIEFSSRSPLSDALASMPIVSPSNLTASELTQLSNGEVQLVPLFLVDEHGNRRPSREWVEDLLGPGYAYWGDVISEPGWTPVYDAQLPLAGGATLNNVLAGWEDGPAPTAGRSLMPERNDHNIRIDFKQDLTRDMRLSASVNYGKSDSNSSVAQQEVALSVPSYVLKDRDLGWSGWIKPNPINPFAGGFTLAAILPEVPNQVRDSERETLGVSLGLEGEFGDAWQWDFGVRYSKSDNTAVTYNQFDNLALSFLRDGRDGYSQYNPETEAMDWIPFEGSYEMLSPHPYFGGDFHTFMKDFVFNPQPVRGRNILKSAELTVQGAVFSLPAGDVNTLVKVGWDMREQFTSELSYGSGGRLINRTLFGLDNDSHKLISEGEDVTRYLAAEAFIPLIADGQSVPFVQSLGMSVSGRVDKLNYFDDTVSSLGVGTVWQINDSLKIRYNYSNAFSAPGFNTFTQSEYKFGLGDYQHFYVGDDELVNPIEVDGQLILPMYAHTTIGGGNLNLEAEVSTSNTLSLDVTPQSLPGFKATLSYHRERQDNQLSSFPDHAIQFSDVGLTPAEFAAKYPGVQIGDYSAFECEFQGWGCYDGYRFPGLKSATVANYVFDKRVQNVGNSESDGVDLRLSYFMDTDFGNFDFILDYGRALNYKRREYDGCPGEDCTLMVGDGTSTNHMKSIWWDLVGVSPVGSPFGAIPKHSTSFRTTWAYSGLEVSLSASYQSSTSDVVRTRVNPYVRNDEEAVDQVRTHKVEPRVNLVAWYDFSEMESVPGWLNNTRLKLSVPDILQSKTRIEVSPVLPSDRYAPLIPQYVSPYGRTFTVSLEKQF